MLKLYKNFKIRDWIGLVLIIGFTFLQVYITMTIVDYIQGIIKAITFVNYHNNPSELGPMINALVDAYGWDGLKEISNLASKGIVGEAAEQIVNIANAKVSDIWFNGGIMVLLAASLMAVQAIISFIASFVSADLTTTIREKVYGKVESFSLAEINQFLPHL